MVTVRAFAEIALKHRCFHVALSDSGHVAALTRLGSGSLIAQDFGSVTAFDFQLKPKAQSCQEQAPSSRSPALFVSATSA